jgi:predicted 3-demethylubiquinone-9 3-methyltransferase (glyoxalase superfamily)
MSLHPPVPFLWFHTNAEEAANFYVENLGGHINRISRYDADSPMPEGLAYVVEFDVLGTQFCAFNGGPYFTQTPAVSFVLNCDTQDDIDRVWAVLCDGGQATQCGWVTDKFGVTWQVTPRRMSDWVNSRNGAAIERMMMALRPMVKLDLAVLEAAFDGVTV